MKKFRELFIFVGGVSPQIITETIYALATLKKPVYPDEIFIITTAIGKRIIKKTLIENHILESLFSEYKIPPITIKDDQFLIPRDSEGQELDDIKTKEDNEIMAELITSFIREKTRDHCVRLHCSIAGGRKTMSFYLGAALQLFGRPWDKLYHVIVSPEFESHPEFFYKPKKNRILTKRTTDGKTIKINTDEARIYLADLPFIRLGHKLQLKSTSFKELVAEGQKEIELSLLQPELLVNLSLRKVRVGNSFFLLTPQLMFIYSIFLQQKTSRCPRPEREFCLDCTDCYFEPLELFRAEKLPELKENFLKVFKHREWQWLGFISRWKSGIAVDVIRQYISKINKQIENQLEDESLSSLCKITSQRIYAGTRYGIKIDKNKIRIE